MTDATHLTQDIQAELNEIGSTVLLQTDNNSIVRLNYKDWAWADVNERQAQASTFFGLDDKHLQLEEKGIIACTASTKDITEMAFIIDKWLAKRLEVFQLALEHSSIKINESYRNLKTLSVDEVLGLRWTYLTEEVAKGTIDFRKEVFDQFRENFSYLFPFFSHDNLYFSDILELANDDFKSPFIFCDNQLIWVGFFRKNSEAEGNKTFKTKNLQEAIKMTQKLLPKERIKTINPLTT